MCVSNSGIFHSIGRRATLHVLRRRSDAVEMVQTADVASGGGSFEDQQRGVETRPDEIPDGPVPDAVEEKDEQALQSDEYHEDALSQNRRNVSI